MNILWADRAPRSDVEILAVVHGKRLLTWDLLGEQEAAYVSARSPEVPVGA